MICTETLSIPSTTSRAIARRSSAENIQPDFVVFAEMARTTLSKSPQARSSRSRCPRVSGSKVPG